MSILNDYAVKVNFNKSISSTNISYLNKLGVVVAPKEDIEPQIVEISNPEMIAQYTDSTIPNYAFISGLNSLYLVLANNQDDLDKLITDETYKTFFVLFIPYIFKLTAPAQYKGAIFVDANDLEYLKTLISKEYLMKEYYTQSSTETIERISKLLSTPLNNQLQYKEVTQDGIVSLTEANNLFDNRIGFTLSDKEKGNRIGFIGNNDSVRAPFIKEYLKVTLQDALVNFLGTNTPNLSTPELMLGTSKCIDVLDRFLELGYILGYNTDKVSIKNLDIDNLTFKDWGITYVQAEAWWRIEMNITQIKEAV